MPSVNVIIHALRRATWVSWRSSSAPSGQAAAVLCGRLLRAHRSRRGKRRRNKTEWATLIMEKRWRWPELEGVLKERRDWSEQASEVHPVDAKEAFLLLGPDGSNLKSLSVRYNVHLSFSSRPMYVKAEGYKGSVDQLRESIKEFREGIIEDTFSLPIRQPVSDDLLHRISKRVGAFLQNERPGVIRITYVAGQQHTLAQAQRLLARRVCETEGTSQTSVLAYAPADINSLKPLSMFPQAYSLYPFLAQRSTLQTLNVSGAFRVRKVGDWLHVHGSEEVERTGGLSRRKGKNIGLDQDHHDIREALMQALPGDIPEGMQRKISASTGHILFTRPPAKISTLVPPLTGTWSLDSFVKWVKDNRAPHIFCSDLPSPLQTAVPRQQDQLHRLIYQAVDPESEGHFISVEALMQNTEQAEQHELEDGETAAPPNKLSVSCTSGVERQLPIMLPDRPLDIRFSVADSRNLSTEQLPKELQHYLADLNAFIFEGGDRQRPITPLIVQHEGRAYVVHSSQSVGRSVVPITHRVFTSDDPKDTDTCATKERVLDLEGAERANVCRVEVARWDEDEEWEMFLRTCDRLTCPPMPQPLAGRKLHV
ncbi:hypothetical protein BD626DRAFT_427196 [Schizophyllum amplum]|uniref:SLS1 C-terminal domain-containing protein n=1 Tax=Schizophyllum amplum TaxID=97359 RepID=A0A550CLP2_9AGAR|nr:hypothetical protein BD626DRAFT_427196 [Auriculariopsis ampla]